MKISCALFVATALLLGSNTADAAGCKYRAPFSGNTIVAGKGEQARLLAAAERWTPWKSFRTWGNDLENKAYTKQKNRPIRFRNRSAAFSAMCD